MAAGVDSAEDGASSRAPPEAPGETTLDATLEVGGKAPVTLLAATAVDAAALELGGLREGPAAVGAEGRRVAVGMGAGGRKGGDDAQPPLPAEPPTRTLNEWAEVYKASPDARGMLRRPPLLAALNAASSRPGSARDGRPASGDANAAGARTPRSPAVRRLASGGAQGSAAAAEDDGSRYESDFEAYSSHLDDDDCDDKEDEDERASHNELDVAELEEADADAVVPLVPSPTSARAKPTGRWMEDWDPAACGAQPRRAAGGYAQVSELERELVELQLQTARASAEQQNLEHYVQTSNAYRTVMRGGQAGGSGGGCASRGSAGDL
jgi:hypothetical protein